MEWWNTLWTWIVFGLMMWVAWELAIAAAKKRYENDILPSSTSCAPVRRPYLIALCAYSMVLAWFFVSFMVVVLLVWCTFLYMTKTLIDTKPWEWLVENFADPSVVFHCFNDEYVWLHVVIAVVALVAMGWIIGFYLTDEDLNGGAAADANSSCYRKMLRALYIAPGIVGVTYGVFVFVQIVASR